MCILLSLYPRLTSVTEAVENDPKSKAVYPAWLFEDLHVPAGEVGTCDEFVQFQEDYVADIEYAREVGADAEMIAKCEEQLVVLEGLLVEKRSLLEETNIKKKKGTKKKK